MKSKYYQNILADLITNPSITKIIYPRPYQLHDLPDIKAKLWNAEWRRAKTFINKNRQKILLYYLGETLGEQDLRGPISTYNKKIAKRIFNIFEPLGEQQLLSSKVKISDFDKISHREFLDLRNEALRVLSERELLVGEDMLGENIPLSQEPQQSQDQSILPTNQDEQSGTGSFSVFDEFEWIGEIGEFAEFGGNPGNVGNGVTQENP